MLVTTQGNFKKSYAHVLRETPKVNYNDGSSERSAVQYKTPANKISNAVKTQANFIVRALSTLMLQLMLKA